MSFASFSSPPNSPPERAHRQEPEDPDSQGPLATCSPSSRSRAEALLEAAIFFDFRQLHGDLDAEAALCPVIRRAAGNRRFLGRLARAALRRRPPLGFLRQLRGDHQGRIDLRAHGTAPIVDLARLLALEAASPETATVTRLRTATERGTVGRTAADLIA
jgi:CBS domain-containing protein